jgi:ATP-dependent Clp protease ATP-binding subunit ClpA
MFKRIKLRIQDIKTINTLIPNAEKQANLMGEAEAGAEHFLLAAIELPDGSAQRIFNRLNITPEKFKDAIKKQYNDALLAVGIDTTLLNHEPEIITSNKTFKSAKPSGQAVMQQVYALKQKDKNKPLIGAHIVVVVAQMKHGIAPRTFRAMGINLDNLLQAAKEEINAHQV